MFVKRQGAASYRDSAEIHARAANMASILRMHIFGAETMVPDTNPALAHIRIMESRIEQQVAAIERLKQSGQDTAPAVHRLELLRRALEEMRIQLGQLSPRERRPSSAGPIRSKLLRGN